MRSIAWKHTKVSNIKFIKKILLHIYTCIYSCWNVQMKKVSPKNWKLFYLISATLLQPGIERHMKSSERWVHSRQTFLAQRTLSFTFRGEPDRAVSAKNVTAFSENEMFPLHQNLLPRSKTNAAFFLLQKLDVLICYVPCFNRLLDLLSRHRCCVSNFFWKIERSVVSQWSQRWQLRS